MTSWYLGYIALVLAGIAFWALVFYTMRNFKKGRALDEAKGFIVAGPAHLIFRNRHQYKLTRREITGWLFVGLLMLIVPFITGWLSPEKKVEL